MTIFVLASTPGGNIWTEVDEETRFVKPTGGIEPMARGDGSLIASTFNDALDALKKNAGAVIQGLKELKPDEVELEFGMKIGWEAGNTIFGLAKAAHEGSFTVTIKWQFEDKDHLKTHVTTTDAAKPAEVKSIEPIA
jgi:hypothetical protein